MCSRATDPYRPDAGCRAGHLEHEEENDRSVSARTVATKSGAICGIAATRARRSAGEPYQVGYQQRLLPSLDVRMVACRGRGPTRLLRAIISLGTTVAAVSQGMPRRQPVGCY
jgi:hypothetical protein